MRFKGNNQGCINLFISSLMTAIFINYLVTGFIDYLHSINSLLIWLNKSGLGAYISKLFGGR
jgi:hypothetical protein